MKSNYRLPAFGSAVRFVGVFFVLIKTFTVSNAQCAFQPATLDTVKFNALPGNCLLLAAPVPTPKFTPVPPACTLAFQIFSNPPAAVPAGATSVTIPSLPVGVTPIVWGFLNAGNFTGQTPQILLVRDVDPPTFNICPTNLSVNLLPNRCDTVLTYTQPNAFDACGLNPPTPQLIAGLTSGSKFPIGSTTMIYKATDVTGNMKTCSFTFVVNDFPTPSLNCRDTVRLIFDATCERTLKAGEILRGTQFGCLDKFEVKIKKSPTAPFVAPNFNAADAGKWYTCQLRNPANNQTCLGKVVALDTLKPVANCSNLHDTTFTLGQLECATLPGFSQPKAFDNCSDVLYSASPVPLDANGQFDGPFPPGLTTEVITMTDASGNATKCQFKVSVNPWVTQNTLICTGQLNVSLDATCELDIAADQVLSGNAYACYDYYNVFLFRNNNWTDNHVDANDVGKNLPYMVQYPPTGQTCWGNVLIEDKFPPALFCKDTTIQCYQAADSLLTGLTGRPKVEEGCGAYTLTFSDSLQNLGCNGSKIFRKWVATDGSGNTATCQSVITRAAGNLAHVVFPKDTILPCTLGTYPTPPISGSPTLNGFPVTAACGIGFTFVDTRFPICDGSFKISRLWTVNNICTQQSTQKTQIITVMDLAGPAFNCLKDSVISSNQNMCCGNYRLPNVRFWDSCSRIKRVEARVPGAPPKVATLIHQAFPLPMPNDTVARFDTLYCLPSGLTTITLVATDHCGNSTSCTFTVRVRDLTLPIAICPNGTNLSLSNDDPNDCYSGDAATINANVLSPASKDDCSPIRITAQRMTPLSNCINSLNKINGHDPCNDNVPDPVSEFTLATQEATSIKFYCCEVGAPVQVRIRVYQLNPDGTVATNAMGQPLMGTCQTSVTVQDISPPSCTPPPSLTVSCSQFSPNAPPPTSPATPDQCCTPTYTSMWTTTGMFCGGVNTRIFTVTDCNGNTSQCSHTVTVLVSSPSYQVRFPDDLPAASCNSTAPVPPEILNNTGCQKFKSVFTDSLPSGSGAGFCYKILRKWVCYDSCTYSAPPTQNVVDITNPPGATGALVGEATPGYNVNVNAYRYTQEILVVDALPPAVLSDCTPSAADNLCDSTQNDPALFNIPGFGDLCEMPATLAIAARDGCSGANVSLSFVLKLDFDENGTVDQTVTSAAPPAGWGITTTTVGTQKNGSVQTPGNNLPQGRHILEWTLTDLCGNATVCRDTIRVRDCAKPKAICKTPFTKNITSNKTVTLFANELNNGSSDNCTPNVQLNFALRLKNTGTGYPPTTSLIFNCNDLTTKQLEMWVADQAGNFSKCETAVTIADGQGHCNSATVSGAILDDQGKGLSNTVVQFGNAAKPDFYGSATTDSLGNFQFNQLPGGGVPVHVTPLKNLNPLNGVSTWDLFLISQHILDIGPFDRPAEFIAADANRSGTITTADVVEIRKLILGITTAFSNNTSWRFVPRDFQFVNPTNPFQPGFPEKIVLDSLAVPPFDADFLAIKTGDVSGNALPSNLISSDDRDEWPGLIFFTKNKNFTAGEQFEVDIRAAENALPFAGFQTTVDFDAEMLMLENVQPRWQHGDGAWRATDGKLALSWTGKGPQPDGDFSLIFRALRSGELSRALRFDDSLTPREAFSVSGERRLPQLFFQNTDVSGRRFEVFQNRPNPFSDATQIGFFLPAPASVVLTVSDPGGRVLLRKTVSFSEGFQFFDLKNEELAGLPAGVLWYALQTENEKVVRKMVRVE